MKRVYRLISISLVVIFIVNMVPAFSVNKGNGVEAATRSEIVKDAASWVGVTPYVWGGTDLIKGCDCSGFVCAIFKRHGLDFIGTYGIRTSQQMYYDASKYGKVLGKTPSKMRDGCIIIFNSSMGFAGHVGICCTDSNGNKEVIHAAGTLRGTKRDSISWLTGGSKGMTIAAIVQPKIINGKVNSTIVSGKTPSTITPTTEATTQTTSQATTSSSTIKTEKENPGYPYPIHRFSIKTYNYMGIKWVQTALNNVNNANLVVDGAYGRLTKQAIKNFQMAYGLRVTGKPNKATVRKLTKVHVANQGVTSIKFKKKSSNITVGQVVKLKAVISPVASKTAKLKWKSSNKKVAKVNSKGVVTARGVGRVRVTATAQNGVKVSKIFIVGENNSTDK